MRYQYLFIPLIIIGCGGAGEQLSSHNKVMSVYNQAYQENFQPDSMTEILKDARNAYVLVDPFQPSIPENIAILQSYGNEVSGYISAGTGEKWREDFTQLQPYLTEKAWSEWPDEYFVSETDTGILEVMKKRIDKMAAWGLDWVELDNMDWLDEESRITYALQATVPESKSYINTLCDYIHSKGMQCMAKNSVEGFERFDGVLYESYSDDKNWWDHSGMRAFLDAGKLVIINHYNETDCDGVYAYYKTFYHNDTISFICEDQTIRQYRHYP